MVCRGKSLITIRNSQRSIPLNTKQIKKDIERIVSFVGYKGFGVFIWITTNATIRRYNKQYRDKDAATDVLSFPFYPHISPGERIEDATEDEKYLGDIIISAEYVYKDTIRWNQTFEQRIRVLLVHSICHLLGYDHIKDSDYHVMKREEERIIKALF